jgi:hypothetical protein
MLVWPRATAQRAHVLRRHWYTWLVTLLCWYKHFKQMYCVLSIIVCLIVCFHLTFVLPVFPCSSKNKCASGAYIKKSNTNPTKAGCKLMCSGRVRCFLKISCYMCYCRNDIHFLLGLYRYNEFFSILKSLKGVNQKGFMTIHIYWISCCWHLLWLTVRHTWASIDLLVK